MKAKGIFLSPSIYCSRSFRCQEYLLRSFIYISLEHGKDKEKLALRFLFISFDNPQLSNHLSSNDKVYLARRAILTVSVNSSAGQRGNFGTPVVCLLKSFHFPTFSLPLAPGLVICAQGFFVRPNGMRTDPSMSFELLALGS